LRVLCARVGFPLSCCHAGERGKIGVTRMELPENQTTLGTALLYTNIGLPIVCACCYFCKIFPLNIAVETFVVTFVVLNAYYLVAFKIWGSNSK
jgi:hypothetical protein